MKHTKRITVARADTKQEEFLVPAFIQLWVTVFSFILTGAFTEAKD